MSGQGAGWSYTHHMEIELRFDNVSLINDNWKNHTHINAYPSGSKQRPNHPTPKPVELMEWLIQHYPPDWTIIDPFAGSGATLRATRNLGRTAIGFEIDPDHTQTAVNLLQQDQEKATQP
ncbi:Modification methylase HindIII [Corynebacterium auriscanis]|nr:Modification methylase HindIII [Corynebacterium auriscanis]